MVMLFSSVEQNKRGRLVTCSDGNIWWKFIFGSYISRRRLESLIAKYSKYPHRCGDWLPHILLKTLDSSAMEPCQSTTPRMEDNSAKSCNSRYSNGDGDKAKLMVCQNRCWKSVKFQSYLKQLCYNTALFLTFLLSQLLYHWRQTSLCQNAHQSCSPQRSSLHLCSHNCHNLQLHVTWLKHVQLAIMLHD